jgi:arylsulfatase A-like enzyme
VYRSPVTALDLQPTILAAAGIRPPEGDGIDLLPYLRNEGADAPQRTLFWRYGNNLALRDGDWKLVRQARRGMREAPFELYDLASDPAETKDLAASQPERTARLRAQLERMNAALPAPVQ